MILYVNACVRKESRTNKIALALLDKLGEYKELKLSEMNLSFKNESDLGKRYELLSKNDLNNSEFHLANEFKNADTIVISAPFWDSSFPSLLKMYIENIYVTNIVSKYDINGNPVGLCKCNNLYYVTTSGGPLNEKYGYQYIEELSKKFFGIKNVKLIKAEMLDTIGFDAEKIINDVISNIDSFI